MSNKTDKKATSDPGDNQHTLDTILIALQKSFSRINDATDAELLNTEMKPIARINNNIKFEIALNVLPEDDKLLYVKEENAGSVKLCISGDINPEILEDEELK